MGKIAGVLGQLYDNALFQESAIVMIKLFKPGRSKNWYAWYMKGEKQDQFSCRTANEREAYRYAVKEVERRLSQIVQPKYSKQTLSEFASDYTEFVSSLYKPSAVKAIKSSFRLFINRVGDKQIVKLKVEECEKFIYKHQPSDFTARKHYGHLRAAFEHAVRWKRVPSNPFKEFKKPKAPEIESDYVNATEFLQIFEALPEKNFNQIQLKDLVLVAFENGMRSGELRFAESKAVNLAKESIYVINTETFRTKSKKGRLVPLSPSAIEAIKRQLRRKFSHPEELVRESKYLFCRLDGTPFPEKTVSDYFLRARRKVFPARKNLHFHSLRHSFGTLNALDGVPLQEIQYAMGHSTVSVTERYAHLDRTEYPRLRNSINSRPKITTANIEINESKPLAETV